jgi:hypothetical protein
VSGVCARSGRALRVRLWVWSWEGLWVWCGIRCLGGLRVWPTARSATTKAARKAARVAAVAAQEELFARTRLNAEDLAVYFSAQQRVDAVDDWFTQRVEVLQERARSGAVSSAASTVWRCGRCATGAQAFVRSLRWPASGRSWCVSSSGPRMRHQPARTCRR